MNSPLRVLVVDDNPQDRRLVIRELRKAFPDVEIAEAIDQNQLENQIDEGDFDLVVTDYHLRWSDGIRVLNAVKAAHPNCPVIMFTATGNEEIAVEAMKQGLDDYIIKNVKHLVRLRGAVQAALEHATTHQRAERLASRLDSLLSQLHVGVFSCSSDGQFVDVNHEMLMLLERDIPSSPDKLSLSDVFADTNSAQEFLGRTIQSRKPQEAEIERESHDGKKCVLRLNARAVDVTGEQPRIDGLLEDITRRKQSEAVAKQSAVAVAQIEMLSPRELDVLNEVVEGLANKVIARRLNISEKTVEKHRSSLMKKLRVRSVAELVKLAMLADGGSLEPHEKVDLGAED